MSKRVLLCLSHSIEEHDQLRLLHSLGYEVASIGGYINPAEGRPRAGAVGRFMPGLMSYWRSHD